MGTYSGLSPNSRLSSLQEGLRQPTNLAYNHYGEVPFPRTYYRGLSAWEKESIRFDFKGEQPPMIRPCNMCEAQISPQILSYLKDGDRRQPYGVRLSATGISAALRLNVIEINFLWGSHTSSHSFVSLQKTHMISAMASTYPHPVAVVLRP